MLIKSVEKDFLLIKETPSFNTVAYTDAPLHEILKGCGLQIWNDQLIVKVAKKNVKFANLVANGYSNPEVDLVHLDGYSINCTAANLMFIPRNVAEVFHTLGVSERAHGWHVKPSYTDYLFDSRELALNWNFTIWVKSGYVPPEAFSHFPRKLKLLTRSDVPRITWQWLTKEIEIFNQFAFVPPTPIYEAL